MCSEKIPSSASWFRSACNRRLRGRSSGSLCLTLWSVGCVSSRPPTSPSRLGMLIQQPRYRNTAFPRDDRIAGRRCSQRHVPLGQERACECLQTLTAVRRPEAPALPLLRAEMGKLWRRYASVFLAQVWVRTPFPPGCFGWTSPGEASCLSHHGG